ncbi:MAG: glutaredoxin domain-containing protein [Pseudomonadota bacterium]|nr:glutaredoxin domain-containing protein [Pseudomonadota bacterium]
MKITLLTNRLCHCVAIEQELESLGYDYERCDIEDNPGVAEQFGVRHCPTLIVDGRRVIPIDENNVTRLQQMLAAD